MIAKVEWHPWASLFRASASLVTNMSRPAERVVAFYEQTRDVRAVDQRG